MERRTKAGEGRDLEIAAQFDAWAPTYESGRLSEWYKAQSALALQHVNVPPGGRALDVGCGTGWALRQLADARPDLNCRGVDISDGMIDLARNYASDGGLDHLGFEVGDWETIELACIGTYDLILCISSFHYFADAAGALKRMCASLRPGGQLLLLERAADRSALTKLWGFAHRWLIRDHVEFRSSTELERLALRSGFVQAKSIAKIQRCLWKGKVYTSLVLIEAHV